MGRTALGFLLPAMMCFTPLAGGGQLGTEPAGAATALAAGKSSVAEKPLVAIMPFEEGMVENERNRHWWWREGPRLLEAIRETFTDALIETGELRVLERSRLDQVMEELRLQSSDWVDPRYAAQLGRIMGAQYLLLGTVTRFDAHETGFIDGGDVIVRGIGADVGLRLRIVEAETAVALASVSASGSVRSGQLAVFSPAPVRAALRGESIVDRAVREAVEELVEKTVNAFKELAEGDV